MQDQVLPVRPKGSCGVQETFPRIIWTTRVYHITIEKILPAYLSFCIYLAELTPKYITSWIILWFVDRHEMSLKIIIIIIIIIIIL